MALTDPESHGGNADDVFDVVSSHGDFCFSGPLKHSDVG